MTKEEIIEQLRDMMTQSSEADVDWTSVNEDSEIATLGFDSLSILDFIYDIQQGIGVEFDAEEMTTVKTVGELATFLQGKGA